MMFVILQPFYRFCFDTLKLTTYESLCADPYLNTDAGTMSPFEHGEVFVLDDGGEVWNLRFSVCFGYKMITLIFHVNIVLNFD